MTTAQSFPKWTSPDVVLKSSGEIESWQWRYLILVFDCHPLNAIKC